MWTFIKWSWIAAMWLLLSAPLGGCAGTVTLADGRRIPLNSNEFEDYVEDVFKTQNRVADELAFALVDFPAEDSQSQLRVLEAAEATLLTACAGLNELATARRDGLSLSLRRKLEFARQVPACEQAAADASRVIEAH